MTRRGKHLSSKRGIIMLLRVTLVTGVGRALMSKKITPCFIGLFQILHRLDDVQVRESLIVETLPLRIEDREVKHLRGDETA
ncbi:hypothetical protein KIW84_022061 [Lathyrus oleraceus]|uniref:Secreted protein n=1 Tax=Pisum sativum TaxID=3888 RepID=A0A9D5B662_PEA|nr:hypothetical protein KIW84_022061 [Pisum sativum]